MSDCHTHSRAQNSDTSIIQLLFTVSTVVTKKQKEQKLSTLLHVSHMTVIGVWIMLFETDKRTLYSVCVRVVISFTVSGY